MCLKKYKTSEGEQFVIPDRMATNLISVLAYFRHALQIKCLKKIPGVFHGNCHGNRTGIIWTRVFLISHKDVLQR